MDNMSATVGAETAAPDRPSAKARRFWSVLGPGLLWAAAAIGVSHLVQSTRAGADGGFSLVWIVLLALALKYPFFEYGPRYAAATGESLVEGYLRLGRWAVWVYLLITLSTALIIQSAVALFTAFIVAQVFGVDWSIAVLGGLVLTGCALLLWIGRFKALDGTIKAVLAVLAVCTLAAAVTTFPQAKEAAFAPWPLADGTDAIGFFFILALVGWMPSAIDISVWSSLWTLAKNRASGVRATVGESLLDFRIGYVGTGLIALAFLTLGATVMHTADMRFSPEGAVFSLQLADLYAATLGAWARPVILVAALTTMFSTTLTVLDGFPRAIARSFRVLRDGFERSDPQEPREQEGRVYWLSLILLAALTVVVFVFFVGNLTTMVDFATVVSFVTAPVLGYLNLRAVTADHVPLEYRPSARLRAFSYVGLTALGGTALIFLLTLFLW
jgi:Mn2+/Fe2+ NRAMP family transporter